MKYYMFLPYGYGFNTRAKTIVHKVSMLFVFFLPVYLNILFVSQREVSFLNYFLSFSCVYCAYEIGYIYNDVYTTKREKSPSNNWLENHETVSFVTSIFPLLISSRVLYIAAYLFFVNSRVNNCDFFILFLGLMYFSFSLHNFFRDWRNVLTDCAINFLKYTAPMVVFLQKSDWGEAFAYIFIEIVLVRSLEFGIERKYILKRLNMINVDLLRIEYYFLLSLISIVTTWLGITRMAIVYGSLYMMVFRTICFSLSKAKVIRHIRNRNGKNG